MDGGSLDESSDDYIQLVDALVASAECSQFRRESSLSLSNAIPSMMPPHPRAFLFDVRVR